MNDTDRFREWFMDNEGTAELGDIMGTHFACEFRKHFTYLRRPPYNLDIRVKLNSKCPSKNLYYIYKEEQKVEKIVEKRPTFQFYQKQGYLGI